VGAPEAPQRQLTRPPNPTPPLNAKARTADDSRAKIARNQRDTQNSTPTFRPAHARLRYLPSASSPWCQLLRCMPARISDAAQAHHAAAGGPMNGAHQTQGPQGHSNIDIVRDVSTSHAGASCLFCAQRQRLQGSVVPRLSIQRLEQRRFNNCLEDRKGKRVHLERRSETRDQGTYGCGFRSSDPSRRSQQMLVVRIGVVPNQRVRGQAGHSGDSRRAKRLALARQKLCTGCGSSCTVYGSISAKFDRRNAALNRNRFSQSTFALRIEPYTDSFLDLCHGPWPLPGSCLRPVPSLGCSPSRAQVQGSCV
jgi:hypothetical protein